MRYELTDLEWSAIKPFLPNKPRGVPRVKDRRVLNGIFWVLRSGAPWRDLPQAFGPYTTCYNRFVRWRRAGVWERIMNALASAHDAAVQMIDTSIVRVHQHAACVPRNRSQSMGRSRGGLTSKIHAVVDTNGLPVRLALTAGESHDNRLAGKLLSRLKSGAMLLADRGYDADWIRAYAAARGAWANIPPRCNRTEPICFSPYLYRARNLVERFFNKIKHYRRVATGLRPITSPSSSLRRLRYGCALMSPRPNGASGGGVLAISMKTPTHGIVVALITTALTLAVAEVGLRPFSPDLADEPIARNPFQFYRYDPVLGWSTIPGVGFKSAAVDVSELSIADPKVARAM
jgi:transposase